MYVRHHFRLCSTVVSAFLFLTWSLRSPAMCPSRVLHGILGLPSKPPSWLWHQYKGLVAPKGPHLLLFM